MVVEEEEEVVVEAEEVAKALNKWWRGLRIRKW